MGIAGITDESQPPEACPAYDKVSGAVQALFRGPATYAIACSGDEDAMRLQLTHPDAMGYVNSTNGESPLHVAASTGQTGMAKLLVDANASVNLQTEGFDQFYIDAEPLHRMQIYGNTPLHMALQAGTWHMDQGKGGATKEHLEVAALLLQARASVGIPNFRGLAPLHICETDFTRSRCSRNHAADPPSEGRRESEDRAEDCS